jgi:hypothetical protein
MTSSVPTSVAWEFYDNLIDRRRVLSVSATLAVMIAVLVILVGHPGYTIDNFGRSVLILAWLLLALLVLALPRVVCDLLDAFQGTPALRLGERGIWSRRWSQLGWVAWSDVTAVVVARGTLGDTPFQELRIDLRRKEFAQLSWDDQAAQLVAWLIGFLMGVWSAPQTLSLINTTSLCGSWDEVMAALDPLLATHGVRKRDVEEHV